MTWGKGTTSAVRLLWRRLGIVGLFIAVLFMLPAVYDVYQKERDSRALREAAENKYRLLQEQHERLGADVRALQTQRGKEAALRELYAVGKEGEGLIIIVEPPSTPLPQSSPALMEWARKFLPFW